MVKIFNKKPYTILASVLGILGVLFFLIAFSMSVVHLLRVVNGVKFNATVKEINGNQMIVEYKINNSTYNFTTNKSHYQINDAYQIYYDKKDNSKAYSDDLKYVFMTFYLVSAPLIGVGLAFMISYQKALKRKEEALKGTKAILKCAYKKSNFYVFNKRLGRIAVSYNGKKYYSDLVYPLDCSTLFIDFYYQTDKIYYLDLNSVFTAKDIN